MSRPLRLTPAQRAILGRLADDHRYGKESRLDGIASRALVSARYYLLGAHGIDCEDDATLTAFLADIWAGKPVDSIDC